MSWLEKFNWKPLTPGKLPAGARISAGKSGSVEMSLPTTADVLVNCVPVNCIPSPESPAKRMVTVSTSSRCLSVCGTGGSITVLISYCLYGLSGKMIVAGTSIGHLSTDYTDDADCL